MTILRQKTVCLNPNSFHVARALLQLFGPVLVLSRQISSGPPFQNHAQTLPLSHGTHSGTTENGTSEHRSAPTLRGSVRHDESQEELPLLTRALAQLRAFNRDGLIREYKSKPKGIKQEESSQGNNEWMPGTKRLKLNNDYVYKTLHVNVAREPHDSYNGDEAATNNLTNASVKILKFSPKNDADGKGRYPPRTSKAVKKTVISKRSAIARQRKRGLRVNTTGASTPMGKFRSGIQTFEDFIFDPEPHEEYFASRVTEEPANGIGIGLLDYKGRVALPVTGGELGPPSESTPWLGQCDGLTGQERLGVELTEFWKYMRPSPLEDTARNAVSIYVQSIIMNSNDHQLQSCEVFGSGANGTSLATSDIDIRLYPRGFETWYIPPPEAVRKGQYRELQRLRSKFKRNEAFDGVVVLNARYPLIAMRHKLSNIRVQVVQSNSTTLQNKLIEEYIAEYPHLLPIYTAVKASLGIRKLSEVFHGGLGSYPLLIMVVASLKLHQPADLPTSFLNFFDFYAHFDSNTKSLGLVPAGVHPKVLEEGDIPRIAVMDKESRYIYHKYRLGLVDKAAPFLLCLQDPLDPNNDLGHKCFAWKHIQATFEHMARHLRQELAKGPDTMSPDHSMLALLVGGCAPAYQAHRNNCAAFGQSQLGSAEKEETERLQKEVAELKQTVREAAGKDIINDAVAAFAKAYPAQRSATKTSRAKKGVALAEGGA